MSSTNYDTSENKRTDQSDNSQKKIKHKHEIEKDIGKPDFTPEKEKIKGPSHATSSRDFVEQGIDSNEMGKNPFS
jgi:hypothetical protein